MRHVRADGFTSFFSHIEAQPGLLVTVATAIQIAVTNTYFRQTKVTFFLDHDG